MAATVVASSAADLKALTPAILTAGHKISTNSTSVIKSPVTASSSSTSTAGASGQQQDVLLDELAEAPRPFPLQPSPLMTPSDHSSVLSYTTVADQRIACFVIGGEPRLCVPQVLSACLAECDEAEVTRLIDDLQIHVQEASSRQIDALKLSNALPEGTPSCGLIRKTDAERLIGELRTASHGHDAPVVLDHRERLSIKHDCFGGCKGFLYPSLHPRPCVQCATCERFFTPEHFSVHNHEKKEISRTVHWGFDPQNWRYYYRLTKEQRDCAVHQRALEEFMNPTIISPRTLKRHAGDVPEDVVVRAKRQSTDADLQEALDEQKLRREILLAELTKLITVQGCSSSSAFSDPKGPSSSNCAPYFASPHNSSTATLSASAAALASALPASVAEAYLAASKLEQKPKLFDPTPTTSFGDDLAKPLKNRPDSFQSEDSEDDTLDSYLAQHLKDPVLGEVRARIADSQRALSQRLDEISMERDQLKNENATLRQYHQLMLNMLSQQQQQQKQAQLAAAVAQMHPLLAAYCANQKAASLPSAVPAAPAPSHMTAATPSGSNSLAGLPNSTLMQMLTIQYQQAQAAQVKAQQQQQADAAAAAAAASTANLAALAGFPGLNPNLLAAFGLTGGASLATSTTSPPKAVSLPTAAQLDPLRSRLS